MVKDLGRGGGRGRGAWEVEERGVGGRGVRFDIIIYFYYLLFYILSLYNLLDMFNYFV